MYISIFKLFFSTLTCAEPPGNRIEFDLELYHRTVDEKKYHSQTILRTLCTKQTEILMAHWELTKEKLSDQKRSKKFGKCIV